MDSADGVPVADLTAIGPAIVALRPEDLADVGRSWPPTRPTSPHCLPGASSGRGPRCICAAC